ncbi:MAG TPA: hypothetical protein VN711_01665 [Candidatus Saccharimonadales bacterium]|nr:hypothetical protein [Candidatus Saccharimonadales bacterium]
MQSTKQAETFFESLIDLFQENHISFLLGGTHAYGFYTGIERPTKDIDFFMTSSEYPKALQLCSAQGYKTELLDNAWIAKIHKDRDTADIIFAERNGLSRVTRLWFEKAREGTVFSRTVWVVAPEDIIRSKSYIQFRERYDGADVVNLILRQGDSFDWDYLYQGMHADWQLLLFTLLLFSFVYPTKQHIIPESFLKKLLKKSEEFYDKKLPDAKITRGMLLSNQYAVAIEKWGYKEYHGEDL